MNFPIKRFLLPLSISLLLFLFLASKTQAQSFQFGIHADPIISWLSSDVREVESRGSLAGFSFGLTFDRYFAPNYAFATGISITHAGGKLAWQDTIPFHFKNSVEELPAGTTVNYKIQYIDIPLGLKLKSNEIGYLTYFADVGLNTKLIINGKSDVDKLSIEGESIDEELRKFNLAYHFGGGIQYSLGGSTAIVIGATFEKNFLDVTQDLDGQPEDKINHNFIRLRFGVVF